MIEKVQLAGGLHLDSPMIGSPRTFSQGLEMAGRLPMPLFQCPEFPFTFSKKIIS
jgi:hypothetical protein